MSNILQFSPSAYVEAVVSATTRADRQSAIKTRQGTGTQTVTVRDGSGTSKLTGTFSGSAFAATGKLLPRTQLSSVSGAGGTPDANWTVEISNAGGDKLIGKWGSSNVWVYQLGGAGSGTLDPGATATYISLAVAQDSAPPVVVQTGDFFANNILISSTSPIGAANDEAEVLFVGRRQLKPRWFGVQTFYHPWEDAQGAQTYPPGPNLYGWCQHHGGWKCYPGQGESLGDNWYSVYIPEIDNSCMWIRCGSGSELQFMIRNYSKTSAWTDADYYFTDLDRFIDAHADNNAKVSIQLHVNVTGSTQPHHHAQGVPSVSHARVKDLVQRVVNRVTPKGRKVGDWIAFWETANEINNQPGDGSWAWDDQGIGFTWPKMAELSRVVKQSATGAGFSIPIVAINASRCMGGGYYTWLYENYFNASAAGADVGYGSGSGTTGWDWTDAIGVHAYIDDYSTDVRNPIRDNTAWTNEMKQKGYASKPIINTEYLTFIDRAGFDGNGQWYDNQKEQPIPPQQALWMQFEHFSVGIALGWQGWNIFDFKDPSKLGNPAISDVAYARGKYVAIVNWLCNPASDICRIVRTTANHIRVTKSDGSTMESWTNY